MKTNIWGLLGDQTCKLLLFFMFVTTEYTDILSGTLFELWQSWWKWKRRLKNLLKFNIQKTKTMACGPMTHGKYMGKKMETVAGFIFEAPESLQMVITAMKLKDAYSLKGKLWPT